MIDGGGGYNYSGNKILLKTDVLEDLKKSINNPEKFDLVTSLYCLIEKQSDLIDTLIVANVALLQPSGTLVPDTPDPLPEMRISSNGWGVADEKYYYFLFQVKTIVGFDSIIVKLNSMNLTRQKLKYVEGMYHEKTNTVGRVVILSYSYLGYFTIKEFEA